MLAKEQAKALKDLKALELKEKKEKKIKKETMLCKCTAILKSGLRKGETCDKNALENSLCKRHTK
jgi:hypothetical protein